MRDENREREVISVIVYPVLVSEIAKRGTKRTVIAATLGISYKSLYNKLSGKVPFTWPEAKEITKTFFPDMRIDDLFMTEGERKAV